MASIFVNNLYIKSLIRREPSSLYVANGYIRNYCFLMDFFFFRRTKEAGGMCSSMVGSLLPLRILKFPL